MAKNNIRSFRYSDEVAAILEKQQGASLNDKFEQLVLDCNYKLPAFEKRLHETQDQIISNLQKVRELNSISSELVHVQANISSLNCYASDLSERISALCDRIGKL